MSANVGVRAIRALRGTTLRARSWQTEAALRVQFSAGVSGNGTRTRVVLDNAAAIVAIELLAAARGIAFRRPLRTSDALEVVLLGVAPSGFESGDQYLAGEIERVTALLRSGRFTPLVPALVPTMSGEG